MPTLSGRQRWAIEIWRLEGCDRGGTSDEGSTLERIRRRDTVRPDSATRSSSDLESARWTEANTKATMSQTETLQLCAGFLANFHAKPNSIAISSCEYLFSVYSVR